MRRLHFADTSDPDMRYLVRGKIPDPFFYLSIGAQRIVVLNVLEIDAFKQHAPYGTQAIPLEPFVARARVSESAGPLLAKVAAVLLEEFGGRESPIVVPHRFPLDIADFLRTHGFTLQIERPFVPERIRKSDDEIRHIKNAMERTILAFTHIESVLNASEIGEGKIIFQGNVLTSEALQSQIELLLFQSGLECPGGIIISSGLQTAMPHHHGLGPLLPHTPIICDIFPRDRVTGYLADMTRTYVKGRPTAEIARMYEAVAAAKQAALLSVGPGKSGREVFAVAAQELERRKYDVGEKGFIHSLGHGLGIEIHEDPTLSPRSDAMLEVGNVITIEPGLYYPSIGGVRLEDVVAVTEDGSVNLTPHNVPWIIS